MIDPVALAPVLADIVAQRSALVSLINAANPPPKPPVVAAGEPPLSPQEIEFGLTETVFFDHFDDPSTVDFDLTYKPGCKWYSPYRWPTSTFTMANSVLTMMGQPRSNDGEGLDSSVVIGPDGLAPVGSGPATGKRGWCFKGSSYVEFCVATSSRPADFPGIDWPAGWSLADECLTIGMEMQAKHACFPAEHVELDYFETGAGSGARLGTVTTEMSLNLWRADGGSSPAGAGYPNCSWNPILLPNAFVKTYPPGFDHGKFNRFGTRYITSGDDGGNGILITRYLNGVLIPECTVRVTLENAYYDILDQQYQRLIIGGHPVHFDWVLVRQRPGANGVKVY